MEIDNTEELDQEMIDLIEKVKKQREEFKNRNNGFPTMQRVYAKTIASELVSVQPMSGPSNTIFNY